MSKKHRLSQKSGIFGFQKTSIFLKIGNLKKTVTLAIPEFKQTSVTLSDGSFGKQVLDFTNRFEREHKASRKLRKMNALLQDLVLMWYHKI